MPESTIPTNLNHIQTRIDAAARRAGRAPETVRLVAVTKSVGVDEMRILFELGIRHFGENRVDVAGAKREALPMADIVWHMIGNVQRRKTKDVLAVFDLVDAVDRLELAEAVRKRAGEIQREVPVLVEVNVSGEEQKHGFAPENLPAVLATMAAMEGLRVRGLMTMAPYGAEDSTLRTVFGGLAGLAKRHGLDEVSMGMSEDFEVAIECGATEVRVGSALFE